MAKTRSKKAAARSTSRSASKSKSRTRLAPSSSKTTMRPDTKYARILAMLRMPTRTTIAAIMTATDWQQHSVPSFLAGVVRKNLGLNLVSAQPDHSASLDDSITASTQIRFSVHTVAR
jgi:hypothetical protein